MWFTVDDEDFKCAKNIKSHLIALPAKSTTAVTASQHENRTIALIISLARFV